MAIANTAPFPMSDPIAEPGDPTKLDPALAEALSDLKITKVWVDWLTSINQRIDEAPTTAQPVTLATQSASIGTTTIPILSVAGGLYRVSYYMRVTTPAGVSSSLAITIGTTDGGVVCTFTGPALTSNNPALPQTGTALVRCDAGSIISYQVAYSSVGTPMIYSLDIVVEAMA